MIPFQMRGSLRSSMKTLLTETDSCMLALDEIAQQDPFERNFNEINSYRASYSVRKLCARVSLNAGAHFTVCFAVLPMALQLTLPSALPASLFAEWFRFLNAANRSESERLIIGDFISS